MSNLNNFDILFIIVDVICVKCDCKIMIVDDIVLLEVFLLVDIEVFDLDVVEC